MKKHYLKIFIFIFFVTNCYSQKLIKDTIIDSVVYNYARYRINGKLKALGNNKKKRTGEWLFFDKKGVEEWNGEYDSKGRKDGEWWYRKREIIYYKNGKKTGKKGFGCKGCAW